MNRIVGSMMLLAWLLVVGPASGQGPFEDRVDALLRQWSQRTSEIRTLYAEFDRISVDKVFRSTDEAEGSARYKAPKEARMDIVGGSTPESHLLTKDGEIWHYEKTKQQITIYELPEEIKQKPNLQEEGPLPFLFGADPQRAKERFKFTILDEDEEVVHARIEPKLQADQKDFDVAEIWLVKKSFLPRKMIFEQPNNAQVTYDFTGIWTGVELNDEDFQPKRVKGWRVLRRRAEENVADAPRRHEVRRAPLP